MNRIITHINPLTRLPSSQGNNSEIKMFSEDPLEALQGPQVVNC